MVITPEHLAQSASEDGQQIALMAWSSLPDVREEHPELALLFHIPNGEERLPKTAAKLKNMGVKAGVPDLFLPVPRGDWCGLFIEMKRPSKSRHLPMQQWWAKALTDRRYGVAVCNTFESARDTILQYLAWEGVGALPLPEDADNSEWITATDIGARFDPPLTAQQVNNMLVHLRLLDERPDAGKPGKSRFYLTKKGSALGRAKGAVVKWHPSVVTRIAKQLET